MNLTRSLAFASLLSGLLTLPVLAQHHWALPSAWVLQKNAPLTVRIQEGSGLDSTAKADAARLISAKLYYGTNDSVMLNGVASASRQVSLPAGKLNNLSMIATTLQLPNEDLVQAVVEPQLTKEQRNFLTDAEAKIEAGISVEVLHYAKTLVKVGSYKSDVHKRLVNHPLEIQLMFNPFELRPGQDMSIQIVRDMRVLPLYAFTVVHKGKDGKLTTVKTKTNAYGVGKFMMKQPGTYLVMVQQTGPFTLGQPAQVKWQHLEASYTFELD